MKPHPIPASKSPLGADRLAQIARSAPEGPDVGRIDRVIAIGVATGLFPCATLLLSMGYDFGREYGLLCLPPTLFFAWVIWLVARNVVLAFRKRVPEPPLNRWRRLLLAAAIPAGFLGCALGCMGLSLAGCSRPCALLSLFGIPAAAILALVFILWPRPGILLVMLLLSMTFLVPNCACDNVVNHRWIAWLGLSPACYAIGVTIALLCISTLQSRQHVALSASCCWVGVSGSLVFFIGHHFLHYPW